ncbi:pilus assembly protein [Acinetobacter ursingii]|uniref:pilus assembly PilX family protein n=1 Tax=Acinetobacter ursingii TaxID=108980 RepID=UPI00244ACF22|nr:pilus assembly protein [Acinetobacter ursingii]MDG9860861.1 pilus assembly protein [Acinetobacter ursingii]MDG9894542.1 pilus assembly protein [Acinetobacter ursingii]MDH0008027.1 pilus assembly protein [Acinetobacter ursingii]MDH0479759.1 pilus assembly protein [Acinetobacter ursingii]MDH2104175.1 pilus assembly protein [Acinetobacter ursingii]
MKNTYQHGATLITVLFVLLLMIIIGTFAVKQSILGLNIATNSQARTLTQQTADAVFFALEQDNGNSTILQKNLSSLGMLGMVKSDNFLNKELVFCYRPKTQKEIFNLQNASIVSWNETTDSNDSTKKIVSINNTELGTAGFCKYTANDFSSGRDVMITQIAVKKSSINTDVPFKFYPIGTDTNTVQLDGVQPVRVVVTTILPGAAVGGGAWNSLEAQINACFSNYTNEKSTEYPDTKTVVDCFADLGIPYSQQVMDYAVVSYATQGN